MDPQTHQTFGLIQQQIETLEEKVEKMQDIIDDLVKTMVEVNNGMHILQNFAESMLLLLPSIDRRINRLDDKLKEKGNGPWGDH